MERHFILVFYAYSLIVWHKLTGELQRQWGDKPLKTFTDLLEAFRTTISFRFVDWLSNNMDVFAGQTHLKFWNLLALNFRGVISINTHNPNILALSELQNKIRLPWMYLSITKRV